MSPEVRQVSWELRRYIDRQPDGRVKDLAHNVWANLSILDKNSQSAFCGVMAEKVAKWEQAIRTSTK
jgi:hypothetical protein